MVTRVPMIFTAFRTKSTGANAFATFFLAFAGTIARTATVIIESDDFMYRLQFFLGLTFNSIIMIQFALYWNAEPTKKRAKIVGPGVKKNSKLD
jgi:hypothetical protein